MTNYDPNQYYDYFKPRESGVIDYDTRINEDANIANDYVWHGRSLETTEEITDWLETLADEDLREHFGKVAITGGFTRALFKQFGRLDGELEISPSTQLGIFVNTARQQGVLKNFTETFQKNAANGLGVGNADTYRLLYHAGIEMRGDDPDATRSMHNFMSMIDNMNRPPAIDDVVTHLQAPINTADIRPLQAAAILTSELGSQEKTKLKPDVALRNALAGTYNLLRFIHDQRPSEEESSNAQKIMQSLKTHHTQDAYAGLRDRTMQVPHIPYTAYIRLANQFSDAISKMEEITSRDRGLTKLDEVSITDLPKALDRIVFIACLGNVSATITEKPAVHTAISTARLAIDNVITYGVERKIGTAPLTLQEAILALRTYLPPKEAAAAIQRVSDGEGEAPNNRDALRKQLSLSRQLWMSDRLKRPGYGALS